MNRIILASGSPRRAELLRQIGISFDVMPSDKGEPALGCQTPADFVVKTACFKGEYIRSQLFKDSYNLNKIVVAADTVVSIDGEVLGKPRDAQDAGSMLRRYSGREIQVYTAIFVAKSDFSTSGYEMTKVRFSKLSESDISSYVSSGEPLDKAGSFGIQGLCAPYIESIEGCYYNVVGLPLALLRRLFSELGFDVICGQVTAKVS
ncbi:MAG: Maf family protein [Candidatus Latescibacterota bacterium]|nr:Maf family protein [Candidatus Latescibacterota bacterium]